MGLLDAIGDIETGNILSEKYGLGATISYLKMREQQNLAEIERKSQIREEKVQRAQSQLDRQNKKKIENEINEMHLLLSKNPNISTYFRQKLIKIMDDLEASSNPKLCIAFRCEFNRILYEAKYCYTLSICVEQLEDAIKEELKTIKPHEKMELENYFIKVYDSITQKEIQNNYKELKIFLHEKYKFRISDRTQKQIDDALANIR